MSSTLITRLRQDAASSLDPANSLSAEAADMLGSQEKEIALLRAALAEKAVSSTMLREMSVINGGLNMQLEGGAAQLLAETFAEQFRQGGAVNYLEMRFTADELNLLVTLQRVDGKTPAQLRKEAEQKLSELEDKVKSAVEAWKTGGLVTKTMKDLDIYLAG